LRAPRSSDASKPTPVGLPAWPTNRPSGWEYLSFLSERIAISSTPGIRSSVPPFSALRNGAAPLNSLPTSIVSEMTMPLLDVPHSTAWLTESAPPPFLR
jgi:hypothetical protein